MKKGKITVKATIWVSVILTAISFAGVAAATCVQPPSGMVSWWGGDNNALDMVGTNNGTFTASTYAAGQVGNAFSFDGVDDYVSASYAPSLDFTADDFSIDAWVYPTTVDTVGEGIAGRLTSDNSSGWGFAIQGSAYGTAGKLNFFANGDWVGQSDGVVATNTWTHVAITRSGNSLTYYVNGSPSGSFTNANSTGSFNNGLSMLIGDMYPSWAGSFWRFGGSIDEVEVFTRALTAEEIASIYNAGSAGKCRSCTPPPSGMVSWWGGDNNALDMVGTNHGAVVGATFADGKVGRAFSFDGVDDYVSISDADFRSDAARTMAFWVNTSDAGAPIIFENTGPLKGAFFGRGNHTTQHLHLGVASGKQTLEWYLGGHHSIQGTSNIADGNWHHLVFVSDGAGTASLYVDGVVENSGTFNHTSGSTSTRFGGQYEGNGSYKYFFNGIIDEVEFFSRALDASEIAALYDAGSAGMCRSCAAPPASMVSWWPFEEGSGVTTADIIGTNNGTLVNGATWATGRVGGALSFDGIDDYLLIGDPIPASLQIQNEISLEAWIYITEYKPGMGLILGSQYDGNTAGASLILNNQDAPIGHIFLQLGDGGWHDTSTTTVVPLNQWVHIVATRRANEDGKIYFNGVLQPSASQPWSGSISYSGAWFAIGQQKDVNRPFKGLIDDVAVYDRALSEAEIQDTYNAGSAGKCSYSIETNSPSNGTIVCNAFAASGYDSLCTITPDTGYYLSTLLDNGASVDIAGSVINGTYAIPSVTEAHTLEATFTEYLIKLVKQEAATVSYYNLLTEAFDGASAGDVNDILLRQGTFTGSPGFDFNLPGVSINLKGGHPSGFGSNADQHSTISDQLTISNGTVTVENVTIQ